MAFKFNALTGEFNVAGSSGGGADTNALYRDGSQPPTADIPWNSFKLTGLANGTLSGDAVNFGQLSLYIPLAQKAAANGVATLDAGGLIPSAQLPPIAITDTFVVASQAAMLALTAQVGDIAVRTDLSKSYILQTSPPSTLINWIELLSPPGAVTSVNSQTGNVVLTTTDISQGTNLYFTNAAAIAAPITGFVSGAGTISAADSILSAIDKLDGNIAGKQASGNYITALTGEVSAAGPGSASATVSNAAVIAKLLTGYIAGAGTVSSSDSILSAIQKIDGNDATRANRTLSNLSSPTAINQHLLFNADATFNIGDSGNTARPSNIYVANNVFIGLNSANKVMLSGSSKQVASSTVDSASLLYILSAEGLTSLTLVDNTSSPTSIIAYVAATFSSVQLDYSITRNGVNAESGQIFLITDGTSAGISQAFASIGSTGVAFTTDVNAGNVRLLYTTTSTGFDATLKVTVRKWLA